MTKALSLCMPKCLLVQGFVKSLLDVADNLERAAGSVTDQSLQGINSDGKALTAKQSSKLLKGLMEGVHLTDRILVQVRPCISGSDRHKHPF